MDTLLVHKLAEMHALQDTIIAHTTAAQQTLNDIKSKDVLDKILPLAGAIIGAILGAVGAFLVQKKLKEKEQEQATSRFLTDTIGKISSNIHLIIFYLKRSAHLEVDGSYQYYNYETRDGEAQKKALEDHYKLGEQRDVVNEKIAQLASDIAASFSTYYKIKKIPMPVNVNDALKQMVKSLLELKHHEGYDAPTKEAYQRREGITTINIVRADISALFEIYKQSVLPVQQLVDELN